MTRRLLHQLLMLSLFTSATLLAISAHAYRNNDSREGVKRVVLPTGQYATPTAIEDAVQKLLNPGLAEYPDFVAGMAVRSRLSPDGTTLAILTAGQNSLYKPDGTVDVAHSTQYVFIYDVHGGHRAKPKLTQVIPQVNAHVGLVFSPDGNKLYAAGGSDDKVYVYTKIKGQFTAATPVALSHSQSGLGPAFALGPRYQGLGLGIEPASGVGLGPGVEPNISGLDISADGQTLVAVNNYSDSISVIDTATNHVRYDHDLRPYFAGNEGLDGGVGGTFPYAVVIKGNDTAYVSSDRDREVVVVNVASHTAGHLIKRIKLDGNALGMTLDASQSKLYVAQDNADQVAVINTSTNSVVTKIDARAPAGMLPGQRYTGAATSAVTLSPDGSTLYAVNSGANSIAVIPLSGRNANKVTGLIPTAYEPHDITFSADGAWMYIINGKSATGPNPDHLTSATASITSHIYPGGNTAAAARARASNEYQFQLERASLVSAPVPTSDQLAHLTGLVAQNNFYTTESSERDAQVMRFLGQHIKHVIYIVKENRTFDQVLGDLSNGANADPDLAIFGQAMTPNYHSLATSFVTLDNFMNPGDGSMDGWSWALQGRVTNTETITQQINYAFVDRGLSYESEGSNRNAPVNFPTVAERDAAAGPAGTHNYSDATKNLPGGTGNLLTGTGNHASADAPFGSQEGYIFSAVLKAGGTVRNYGFHVNNIGPQVRNPFSSGSIQVAPLDPSLAALTDVYFRGFDMVYPDLWRYEEWKREFDQYVANGKLPSLTQLRISHDHMGSFSSALAGLNTPETQQADCDMTLGLIVEAVANSPYASDTLILVTEDDVQDGPDHVASHRGPAFVIGPYVKHGAVIRTRYSQVNVLRTIEDILGTEHINLNTAFQRPMANVFDTEASAKWSYTAQASTMLATTTLALSDTGNGVKFAPGPIMTPRHNAAYWEEVTAGFDFSQADQVPPAQFNRVLWAGLMDGKPYPTLRREGSGEQHEK
jgi:YVTN family beta-propeller protein